MIERVIILRHGEPDGKEGLSKSGIAAIRKKAPRIEAFLDPESMYPVFSSHLLRAVETAVTYAKNTENALWIRSDLLFYDDNWAELAKFINKYPQHRSMVIVSHLEQIRYFPPYYCRKHLGFELLPLEGKQLGFACGVLIDRVAKTCTPI